MKPIRVFSDRYALVAVVSVAAVGGCNAVLGNDAREYIAGSGGTAGAFGGGTGEAGAGGAGAGEAGAATGGTSTGSDSTGGSTSSSHGGSEAAAGAAGAPDSTTTAGQGGSNGGSHAGGGGNSGTGGGPDTPLGPLAAPTGLEFTFTSETEGTLAWQAVEEATTYTVEIATDADFMVDLSSVSETGTTANFSGLNADTRYEVRVRANGSHDRTSDWSRTSGITPLDPPKGLTLDLYVSPQGTSVGYSDLLWIEPPDDLKNGGDGQKWHYAQGTASATCAPGTTVQYQFDANYDSNARKGYTDFGTPNVAYIVRPAGRVTFYVKARCVGPNTTKESSEISSCRRNDNSAC